VFSDSDCFVGGGSEDVAGAEDGCEEGKEGLGGGGIGPDKDL
jgi:hypothetical protein